MKNLEEGWCHRTPKIIDVKLFSLNKNFKYLNEEQKLIIGKSNSKTDDFDILHFVPRNVEKVSIPSQIKRISSFAFSFCVNLKSVDFENESKLESIGVCAFAYSTLNKIMIPSSLISINNGAFFKSLIKNISISSSVEFIDDFSFARCECLEIVEFDKIQN